MKKRGNYIDDGRIMMSNGIVIRQNEEKSIAMLAAQRQLYRNVKKFNILLVALSVWIPFILAIILLFLSRNPELKYVSYILSIISMFFSFVIDKYIRERKYLAAFIQQKFDVYVYGMPWDKRIFGKDKNIDYEVTIYSKKILENANEKNKLKNWYTPGVDKKDIIDGILECQRENFWWDVGLRKRFRLASITLIIILFVMILAMGLWKNERIIDLLWRLAFIVPMLKWLLDTVNKLNKDISTLNELDNDINNNERKTMEDLQDIQKVIFQHRKECYAIPEWIYNIFKNNDEDRAYREVRMGNKQS
ncbi:S-4TM family putative pore-forming effector [Faecalitalea cylindroides]|uniref:S-4TM family putative pore-forming effector n=2 Tax=Faecalitalea cylindroides TaxID=39483 RepID=A0AAW6FSP7_9FIRM|nr:S-4TM family putative pore-forming effector [Faecalitalea cylindroides]